MNRILTFLILYILSFDISAQEIPKNPNAYDLDSNKTGAWTILYDNDWNITDVIDSVEFYRVITYEKGFPKGKVLDFYVNGQKQWEGYLLSDDPDEIMDGECIWFTEDSLISEIKNYKNGSLRGISSYYNYEGIACIDLEYDNDSLISYKLFEAKHDSVIFGVLGDLKMVYYNWYDSNINNNYTLYLSKVLLNITEKLYAKDNVYYNDALYYIQYEYRRINNYEKAIYYGEKYLENTKVYYGESHEEYIFALNEFASTFSYAGRYSESLEYKSKALELSKRLEGIESENYLTSLNNIAYDYGSLGNRERALEYYLQNLNIRQGMKDNDLAALGVLLDNIASSYGDLGMDSIAIHYYLQELKIYNDNQLDNSFVYPKAFAYSQIAMSYLEIGSDSLAKLYNNNSLSILKRILPDNHPEISRTLNVAAMIDDQLGHYDMAIDKWKECIDMTIAYGNIDSSFYYNVLSNLGWLYHHLEMYSLAFNNFKEIFNFLDSRYVLYQSNLNANLSVSTYNQLLFYNMNLFLLDMEVEEEKYNRFITLKGSEFNNNNLIYSQVFRSKDSVLVDIFNKYVEQKELISAYYENNLNSKGLSSIESLYHEKDNLERQLVKRVSDNINKHQDYSFNTIVSYLKEDEIYIDIIEPFGGYYAYITHKGIKDPELIFLGVSSDFDSIYNYYSNYTQERPSNKEFSYSDIVYGNICYQNFWSKLEPYLEGVSTVYLSTEGVYSKINPNVLYDSTSSSFLMDKYDVVYVSNVEDFVHQKENIQLYERPDDLYAVLVGNPTFLLEDDVVVLASNESQSRSINQDELDSLQRGMLLSDLPGTQMELDLISDNLKSKGWDVELISGVDATETRVKSLEAPKILHIATHGFFFEDQKMVKRSNMISTDNKKAVANPMFRSGLIFSGAENTMNGEILADGNGWLNSYEASLLNLRGTELVVLSACKTGSGDVQNGKGVYGLQRAIRLAGAESLIMSMWEVDDNATQELMTSFYDYWIDKKMSKKEAFKEAQQKIRQKYKHPYYWGAFIMLGE